MVCCVLLGELMLLGRHGVCLSRADNEPSVSAHRPPESVASSHLVIARDLRGRHGHHVDRGSVRAASIRTVRRMMPHQCRGGGQ